MIIIFCTKQNHKPQTTLEFHNTVEPPRSGHTGSKAQCNMRCRLDHGQVSACEGCNTRYLAKKSPFLSPTFLVEIEGRIC